MEARTTIAAVDVFKLTIPLRRQFVIALGRIEAAANILVRVRAAGGTAGWGEGSPLPYVTGETQATAFEAARALAPLLPGQDALALDARAADLERALAGSPTARSAIDMALHDLAARLLGVPLYALLGGEKRTLWTDDTIGINPPEVMARAAREVLERGFPAVKIKLGTGHDEDVARVRAVRQAIGPAVPLRVDANQGWDAPAAVRTLRDLAPFDVQYCEQPVARHDLAGLRRARQAGPIPIMADEALFDAHDALRLAELGACDYFNIKLAKCGGLRAALQIDAIARAAGIPCMIGCMWETRLGLSANAHLMSARPNIVFADLDGHTGHALDPIVGGAVYHGGRIELPDTPGHGATVDEGVLAGLERASAG